MVWICISAPALGLRPLFSALRDSFGSLLFNA